MTTHEDVCKLQTQKKLAEASFRSAFQEYLTDILRSLEMWDTPVYSRELKVPGVIRIVENDSWSGNVPFRLAFFPLKKDGTPSKCSRYVYFGTLEPELYAERLKANFSAFPNNH